MKKLIALTLMFAGLALLITAGWAQNPDVHAKVPTLPCCKCLGESTTLNISTGQGSPTDPIWRVNGGPAYTTPPYPGWITTLSPARWIQPVANPKPSSNVPPGVYKYTMKFSIPKCTIPGTARLSGRFAADNTVKAFLDGTPIPGAACGTINCFKAPDAPIPLNLGSIAPGSHVLTFEVRNVSGPSGLVVNAQIRRECKKEMILEAANVEQKVE